jgi:acyl dehydratase
MNSKPRGRYWQDFEVGEKTRMSGRTIEACDVHLFAGLGGDFNPIHVNDQFARQSQEGQRLVHGLLTLAVSGGHMNQSLQYEGTTVAMLGIDELRFPAPVFFGDTIVTESAVTGVRPSKSRPGCGIVEAQIEVKNQREEVVLRYKQAVLMTGRPEA